MQGRRLVGGGAVLAGAALAALALLPTPEGEGREVHSAHVTSGELEVGDLRARAERLEGQLATSDARVRELEEALAAVTSGGSPVSVASPEVEGEGGARAPDPATRSGDDKQGGGKARRAGKPRPGLPEGMTREQQDQRVQALVQAHGWGASVTALRAAMEAKSGGRGLSLAERRSLESFFGVLEQLGKLGVDLHDPRVERVFVPAWVSGLGADLDPRQAEQLASFVDEAAQRAEESEPPEPEHPLRYAHLKARDVARTQEVEAQLRALLRPEQLEAYLAEVGDDPFDSGLGLKTDRLACPATTVAALAAQVSEAWSAQYRLPEQLAPQVHAAAYRFATSALVVPGLPSRQDAAARRQAVLRRARQLLALQGDAERDLLMGLPLSSEERAAAFERHCPVLELPPP